MVPMVRVIARNMEPNEVNRVVDGSCEGQVPSQVHFISQGGRTFRGEFGKTSPRVNLPNVFLFPVISFPFVPRTFGATSGTRDTKDNTIDVVFYCACECVRARVCVNAPNLLYLPLPRAHPHFILK